MQELNLRELKGAPLSIVIAMMIAKRAVTVEYLVEETGYSKKPVLSALKYLENRYAVTKMGRSVYMLTGEDYQLPLYWDEKQIECPMFEGLNTTNEGLSTTNGGDIPEWEVRVSELERRVSALELRGRNSLERGETTTNVEILPRTENELRGRNSLERGETTTVEVEIPSVVKDVNLNILTNQPTDTDSLLVSKSYAEVNQLTAGGENATNGGEIPSGALAAWQVVKGQLKGSIDRGTYSTLIESLEVLGVVDGHFTIATDNEMKRGWLEQRFTGTIERMLETMGYRSVSFVVCENSGRGSVVSENSGQCSAVSDQRGSDQTVELLPERGNARERELAEICNDYLLDPIGVVYTLDELKELIAKTKDPRVLRFVLPRAKSFQIALRWVVRDYRMTKICLMAQIGISGQIQNRIADNEEIPPELIDFWYWTDQGDPDYVENKGLTLKKILDGDDRLYAEEHVVRPMQLK